MCDISEQKNFIESFVMGDLNNVSEPLKCFYYKIEDSRQSFLLLYDNRMYFDAMIIAGHMLEVYSILNYINYDKDDWEQRYKEYGDECLPRQLELYISEPNLTDGAKKIFLEKVNSLNDTDDNKTMLKECAGPSNLEKVLKKHVSRPNKYIEEFANKFDSDQDKARMIEQFYMLYCSHKHFNLHGCNCVNNSFNDPNEGKLAILGVYLILNDMQNTNKKD